MVSARLLPRSSFFFLCTSLLSACAGGVQPSPDEPDAGELAPGEEAPNSSAGALLDGSVVASDSGSDAQQASASTTSRDSGPATCGDVVAAAHPPFEAIKKLATTREPVRVLVYGQSISEQSWWSKTKAWLERTYPNGNLVMEQHAHGGCPSQCLIGHSPWGDGSQLNRLPEDVFSWHPDLIIFHVYGDHHDYQHIMRAFKEGCAAFDDYRAVDGSEQPLVKCTAAQRMMSAGYRAPEVLVQNDFPQTEASLSPCPPDATPASNWNCFMNEHVIPEQVATYHYTLQDNWHQWPAYIKEHGISLKTLVADDDTHLREPGGTDLMFQMTAPHLCYPTK